MNVSSVCYWLEVTVRFCFDPQGSLRIDDKFMILLLAPKNQRIIHMHRYLSRYSVTLWHAVQPVGSDTPSDHAGECNKTDLPSNLEAHLPLCTRMLRS